MAQTVNLTIKYLINGCFHFSDLSIEKCVMTNDVETHHVSPGGFEHDGSRCVDSTLKILVGSEVVEHNHSQTGADR